MSRVQLAINVENIDESIAFYTKLFNTQPAKIRPGYANFAITEPPLKLVLLENPGQGGSLNHLGVEVSDVDTVDTEQTRLAATGLASIDERGTTCCYAKQDKFWVQGTPNGESWEIYTTSRYRWPRRYEISSIPMRVRSANRSCSASVSAQTRDTTEPTVRHATRINSVTAVLEVCVANQATCSSKASVCPASWRAQGTWATTTPCCGQDTRGESASRNVWITPRSNARNRRRSPRPWSYPRQRRRHRPHRPRCRATGRTETTTTPSSSSNSTSSTTVFSTPKTGTP